MHALTNSGAILLAVLIFFLLILIAELSYIFCRRIRFLPDPASKEVVLEFLMCCKKKNHHHSRVEPTGIVSVQIEDEDVAATAAAEDTAVDKWQVSRLLFTIEEEDLDLMEADDDDVEENNKVEVMVEIPVEYSGEPTPFLTPCDSPPYFTPSPSPGRDHMDDDVINDVYDVSNSRGCCFNFQDSQMC